jgi:hypothetical protein
VKKCIVFNQARFIYKFATYDSHGFPGFLKE